VTGPKPGAHSLSTPLLPDASIFTYGTFFKRDAACTGCVPAGRQANSSRAETGGGGAMKQRSREKGGASVKAVVWTLILLSFIYAVAMALPAFITEYEFQDSLQDIARYASANRRSSDQVRSAVLTEAQKEDLPVQADNINVNYSVIVDFKVYQWTVDFHPAANNAALM